MGIARDVAAALPDGGTLVVASSLPVRALEWCMAPRDGLTRASRTGVRTASTASSRPRSASRRSPRRVRSAGPVVALCGDLCFLHDTNGLLGAAAGAPVTFVVVDNDGGGIFSYLPQQELPEFEALFGTPHGLDLVAVARAHGVTAERVADLGTLKDVIAAGETRVLVVPVDRALSVEQHRALWNVVAGAVAVAV